MSAIQRLRIGTLGHLRDFVQKIEGALGTCQRLLHRRDLADHGLQRRVELHQQRSRHHHVAERDRAITNEVHANH